MNRFVKAAVAATMTFAFSNVAVAQVTEEDLANDQATPGDILTNGMGGTFSAIPRWRR